jgi:adenylate kinase family enzyme
MDFPIFNTIQLASGTKYDLNDPVGRRKYFNAKVGKEIEEIKQYLDSNTFLGFLLAKKSAGKGTYSKLFEEVIGSERFAHISVGDVVRNVHKSIEDDSEKEELLSYMKKYYRSFTPLEDAFEAFLGRSQDKLIPTEFILTLVKREIEKVGRKAIFLDGLPRSMDQISYSLYFRNLINFRDDPDFFVLIDIPESVIDARMKTRVVCPKCQTSRSPALLPTKFVKYDEGQKEFYLLCDNGGCDGFGETRLVGKDGDSAGVESIRDRLTTDGDLIKHALGLSGIPLVKLRNSVPVEKAKKNVEEFELTPGYSYEVNKKNEVEVIEEPWIVKDDKGIDSYSLLAAPVAVGMIRQIHSILFGKTQD